jgi:drug/metabolite transporter (DMT)-like permease
MRRIDFVRLTTLAAIWGASFLFMRILAPVLGALWTTQIRVTLAGIAMLLFMLATQRAMAFGKQWKSYLILGIFNSALPFSLFSYAALTLPAGYSAILNATSPLWGTLIAAVVLNEKLTLRKIGGLLIGISGVSFLVRLGPAEFSPQLMLAAGACVCAAICYGIAGAYSKKASLAMTPPMMATGSQLAAMLVLLPIAASTPIHGEATPFILLIAAGLALMCTAVAYFIYFRLIADIGPTKTLTVTFLIPLFAMIWAAIFLHETINTNTLIGCAMVIVATCLVVFQGKPKATTA